jgi:hypothetical protein
MAVCFKVHAKLLLTVLLYSTLHSTTTLMTTHREKFMITVTEIPDRTFTTVCVDVRAERSG